VHGHGEIPVGLGTETGDHRAHLGDAMRAEKPDLSKHLQFVDHGLKSAIQLRHGAIDVGFDRHQSGGIGIGFEVGAAALGLGLRQKDRTFSFTGSHLCLPPQVDLVRARSVLVTPGAARLLWFISSFVF